MIITLLTDFGTADSYVAEVKGVLVSLARGVQLVDVSHDIAPGNIRAGAFVLGRAWPRFPPGTVHLAVVDPGVGAARRAIAAQAAGHKFVAPDNGLLSLLPADAEFVSIAIPAGAAPTFHGRDVFAPAAASLARGARLSDIGAPITDPTRTSVPGPRSAGSSLVGEVVHVDRFGTLITNITAEHVARLTPGRRPGVIRVVVEGQVVGLSRTFADVAPGELVAFIGSGGTIEIAARDGSAAILLKLGIGAAVRIEPA